MDFNWFWEGLLTNGMWRLTEIAMIPVVGLLTGYLKSKGKRWVNPAIYGLCASAAVTVIFASLPFLRPETNHDNIQARMRSWLDHFSIPSRFLPANQDFDFAFEVLRQPSKNIFIMAPRTQPAYIELSAEFVVDKSNEHLFKPLTDMQRKTLVFEFSMELAKAGIPYENLNSTFSNFKIVERVPIAGLTESVFLDRLDDMSHHILFAGTYMGLRLQEFANQRMIKPTSR